MDWLSVQYFIGQKRHLESTQLQSNGLKSEKNNNLGNPHILIVSGSTKGILILESKSFEIFSNRAHCTIIYSMKLK